MARHNTAEREVGTAGDAGRRDGLILAQAEHTGRDEGGDELGQGGVMPADLADAGGGGQAPAHLQFVGDEDADDDLPPIPMCDFAGGQRGGDDVGGVGGVLLPVDVVVVQRPHQERVHQRSVGDVRAVATADDRRLRCAAECDDVAMGGLHVLIWYGSQRTAGGIEQETLGLAHRVGGYVFVLQAQSELGHCVGDTAHRYLRMSETC